MKIENTDRGVSSLYVLFLRRILIVLKFEVTRPPTTMLPLHHVRYTQQSLGSLAFETLTANNTMSPPSKLPAWPLTNMGNAEFTATNEAFVGEHTVIGK